MAELRVGVVGYSTQKFDEDRARRLVNQAYDQIAAEHQTDQITVVSGLSNFGLPKIAYEEAVKRNWKTAGVTLQYRLDRGDPLFPVDEQIVINGQRGDESPAFLDNIHMLVRVGGGDQSTNETEAVKASGRQVIEHDLAVLPD